MKVHEILTEDAFSDAKAESGYHTEFPSINGIWLDTFVHMLRHESPYRGKRSASAFADKVEQFYDSRFGKMVYYKGDENIISRLYNTISDKLDEDSSIDNIKTLIHQTTMRLNRLRKMGTIAPEGSHSYETDFWADQREKDDYMGRER